MSSRLRRNVLYTVAGQGLILALGIVAVRSIYGGIGGDALGVFFFATIIGNMASAALDLGIATTVIRQVASASGPASRDVEDLLRTAALYFWALYGIVVGVLALSAGAIAEGWLSIDTITQPDAVPSLTVLGCAALLTLPRSLYGSVFKGLQEMGVPNAIDVAATVVQQTAILLVVGAGGGLWAVSLAVAGSAILWTVSYVVAAARCLPARALVPGFHLSAFRTNRRYAFRMMGVSLLAMVHMQSDKVIASRFLSLATFGMYSFAFGSINRAMLLTSAVSQAALPSLTALVARGERAAMLAQYHRLHQLLIVAMAIVFGAVPFALPPLFGWMFGVDEAMAMVLPGTLVALGFYMNSTLNMPYVLSLAMGKPEIALASNAWALVGVLPVTAALVWQWGAVGAGASWVLYNLFTIAVVIPRISRECTQEPTSRWLGEIARLASPALLIYGSTWAALDAIGRPAVVELTIGYLASTLAYLAIGWTMLSRDERQQLLTLFRWTM